MLSRFFGRNALSASASRLSQDTADLNPRNEQHSEDQPIPRPPPKPVRLDAQQASVAGETVEDIAARTVKLTFPKERRKNPPSEFEIRGTLGGFEAHVQRIGFKEKYAALVFDSTQAADEFMEHWRDLFPSGYKARRVAESKEHHAGEDTLLDSPKHNERPDEFKENRNREDSPHLRAAQRSEEPLDVSYRDMPSLVIEEYDLSDANKLADIPADSADESGIKSEVDEAPMIHRDVDVQIDVPKRKLIPSVRFDEKDSIAESPNKAESPGRSVQSEEDKIRRLSQAFLRSTSFDRRSRVEDEVNMQSLSNFQQFTTTEKKQISFANPPLAAKNERPVDPDASFVSHVTDRVEQKEVSFLRDRVRTLELEAELRASEKAQTERGKRYKYPLL